MTDNPSGYPSGANQSASETTLKAMNIGSELLDNVQDVLKGGRIRTVRIKMGNKTVKEIPVEAAAITAVLLALIAVVVSQLRIELEKA